MLNMCDYQLIKEALFTYKEMLPEEDGEEIIPLLKKISDLILQTDQEICLWSFFWDFGESGCIESLFKATKEEVENLIGQEVHFSQVLGKSNEIHGTIEEDDIQFISDDPLVVRDTVECGYNPLEFVVCKCKSCGEMCYEEEFDESTNTCIACLKNIQKIVIQ